LGVDGSAPGASAALGDRVRIVMRSVGITRWPRDEGRVATSRRMTLAPSVRIDRWDDAPDFSEVLMGVLLVAMTVLESNDAVGVIQCVRALNVARAKWSGTVLVRPLLQPHCGYECAYECGDPLSG
jgi:hypothetical protein